MIFPDYTLSVGLCQSVKLVRGMTLTPPRADLAQSAVRSSGLFSSLGTSSTVRITMHHREGAKQSIVFSPVCPCVCMCVCVSAH